jgi:hypothetical protein
MMQSIYIFPGGKPKADVDTGWNTKALREYVVPAGKRWLIMGYLMYRDTDAGAATWTVDIYNSDGGIVARPVVEAHATGIVWKQPTGILVMESGWKAQFITGEAQGANAYSNFWVLEMPT